MYSVVGDLLQRISFHSDSEYHRRLVGHGEVVM